MDNIALPDIICYAIFVRIKNKIMNIEKRRKNKVLTIIIIAVIAIALFLVYWFVIKTDDKADNTADNTTTNNTKQVEVDSDDTSTINTDNNASKPTEQTSPEQNNTGNEISGYVTSKNIDGNVLRIRVQINELLASGQCELKLSKSGMTVTKTAGVYNSASISTCEGFDVPISELSAGNWTITINVTSGSRSGAINDEVSV